MEENELQDKQVTEINDLIADFVPASSETANTTEEVHTDETKAADEGEKRSEEKAGEQESTESSEGKKEEVVAPIVSTEPIKTEVDTTKAADTTVLESVKKEDQKEETELERFKRENTELRTHLEELAGKAMGPSEPVAKTSEQIEADKKQANEAARQILKFLPNEEIFDEVMKNADSFNALLTSVVNTAVERSLRLVPRVATQIVDQQASMRELVKDFYTDNKDLLPHKKYVGFVSNEIASQHADWTIDKVLVETEKEVRSRLKLARTSGAMDNTGSQSRTDTTSHTVDKNPGFVPSSGGGRKGSGSADGNMTSVEKEIMSLIS
jgi:hypothetical protein